MSVHYACLAGVGKETFRYASKELRQERTGKENRKTLKPQNERCQTSCMGSMTADKIWRSFPKGLFRHIHVLLYQAQDGQKGEDAP